MVVVVVVLLLLEDAAAVVSVAVVVAALLLMLMLTVLPLPRNTFCFKSCMLGSIHFRSSRMEIKD